MSYNKSMVRFLAAFGLTRKDKLPVGGASARVVDGIKVWINPQGPAVIGRYGRTWKRSTHRVMCECPNCGRQFSAGRLHQHVCKPHLGAPGLSIAEEAVGYVREREDFHSDEGRSSADDEPYFPDA